MPYYTLKSDSISQKRKESSQTRQVFEKGVAITKKRGVGNLYDGLKLVEKCTATLLKKTRQIDDTNKKLKPVES